MIKQLVFFTLLISFWALCSCTSNSISKPSATVKNVPVQKEGDVIFGSDTVTQTIFLYASYNCDYCRYFFSRTYPELKTNFLDKGKLKLVVKWLDFNENPQVMYALQAASCIGQFGVYEKFHQLLLVNPTVVFTEDFALLIDDIMQDNSEIEECILQNNEYEYLRLNVSEFRANNFSGTPTFVMNSHVYNGFISYNNFQKILEQEFNNY